MDTVKHISEIMPDVLLRIAEGWFAARFQREPVSDTEVLFAFTYFLDP